MHNLEAEARLLGACLLKPVAIVEAGEYVDPHDFYRGAHRTIFETLRRLHEQSRPTDTVTVSDELERNSLLADVGGAAYLAELLSSAHLSAVTSHARIVADLAARRRVVEVAERLRVQAGDMAVDVDAAKGAATQDLALTRSGPPVVTGLVDAAMVAAEHRGGLLGWGAPWRPLEEVWRIVPGWVHGVSGWRSAGKSALIDALLVGLAGQGVRSLVWSPEGAPCEDHMLRLADIHANRSLSRPDELVEALTWVEGWVGWVDHEQRTTVPQILASADAYAAKHRLDLLVIDPFTSVEKFDGDPSEPWDRMLNRHLSRLQGWARARRVAVLMVIHPKQRDRLANGLLPVCTSNDLHGGAMFGNQLDSLVSVWRDEQGKSRPKEQVDVLVQKVRHDGRGGQMGQIGTLSRSVSGRYHPVLRDAGRMAL